VDKTNAVCNFIYIHRHQRQQQQQLYSDAEDELTFGSISG